MVVLEKIEGPTDMAEGDPHLKRPQPPPNNPPEANELTLEGSQDLMRSSQHVLIKLPENLI